jgi:hypothetical protein
LLTQEGSTMLFFIFAIAAFTAVTLFEVLLSVWIGE